MLIALVAALLAAPVQVANINDGNAMTLPAGRHMVRIDPGGGRPAVWLAAIQQDGADGHALGFYRSDDEAQSWSYYAPIQDDPSETDRVDLLAVGSDIALVYSYEGPTISGSALHSVYFQWWRYDGSGGWSPSAPVTVMQAAGDSSNGYLRGEIAIDGSGRIWVQAMRIEPDGSFTVCMAVSTNGGASFTMQPTLGSFANRPGGRILSLGNRLMFLYSTHGVDPGYMRIRKDTDPLGSWSAAQVVFPEGIYHGAALSAVGDGNGGVHLVYKDVNERLAYRFFNGSSWGGRTDIEDVQDWATQPATSRIGSDVLVFWNHPVSTNTDYRYRYLLIHNGSLGGATTLDDSSGFKGYPAAAEVLPVGVPRVPCFYGNTPDANSSGTANVVDGVTPGGGGGGGTPDAGTPDAGTPDAGTPDAGTPDGGTTGGGGGTLFSDTFNRTASTLPATWTVVKGAFIQDTRANADLNAPDQAMVKSFSCADCTVQAEVDGFGDPLAIDLRVQSASPDDRYDLALLSTGHVQIRKHRGGVVTVLGDVASGIADTGNWSTLSLSASGAGPVSLVAKVNGVVKLGVNDTANVLGAGSAGFSTALAGIWFRNFVVTGTSGGPVGGGGDGGTPDAGTPDAGTPDAGTPDAGTPDAGTPDAGTPDAGTPDAGTPDAGTPDAGTPDAGTPDAGTPDGGSTGGPVSFSDSFNRNTSALGAPWVIVKGAFIDDTRANSDNDAQDQAMVSGLSCGDCTVQADVVGFGDPVAIDLRVQAPTPDNRYDLILQNTGHVQIRKHRGGVITVLGDAASGIADTGNWSTLTLTATGSGPVSLVAKVNGAVKVSVTDTSNVLGAGSGGISAWISGIWFRNFSLKGTGASSGGGGGTDGGTDAGTGGGTDGGTGGGSDGGSDAGTDAGTDAGSALAMQITYTGTDYDLMAVDRFGTAYGNQIGDSNSNLYASTDGRAWTYAGRSGNGWDFHVITALSSGTLLADTQNGDQHMLERSTDRGATWTDVLQTGVYYALSPHSYAELDGAVYYTEYQVFTEGATPIHLWKSVDDGKSWSVVQTFTTHRHGHGLIADPARHALWAVFGDTDQQAGTYRSTDAGKTWTAMATAQPGDIVDGTILPDGSLLAGQDISYKPDLPHVARIGLDKTVTDYVTLPSASYSTHAVSSGGYVVGATREQGADVTPDSVTTGSLWGSGDGVHWSRLLDVQEASTVDDCRTDVYWELASGELVVNVKGASGFGADGRGYLLIRTQRH